MSNAIQYYASPDVGGIFAGIAMVILVIGLISWISPSKSKSRRYRETMVDLYVVGKIRQYADKDKIDLKEELRLLLQDIKDRKRYSQDIDHAIEDELKEDIVKSRDTKTKQ